MVEDDLYPNRAFYTSLRSVLYNGQWAILKLMRNQREYAKPAGAVYLHYKSNLFELKHQNLVEIYGVSPNPNGELIMKHYRTSLLEYRGHMNHRERLRALDAGGGVSEAGNRRGTGAAGPLALRAGTNGRRVTRASSVGTASAPGEQGEERVGAADSPAVDTDTRACRRVALPPAEAGCSWDLVSGERARVRTADSPGSSRWRDSRSDSVSGLRPARLDIDGGRSIGDWGGSAAEGNACVRRTYLEKANGPRPGSVWPALVGKINAGPGLRGAGGRGGHTLGVHDRTWDGRVGSAGDRRRVRLGDGEYGGDEAAVAVSDGWRARESGRRVERAGTRGGGW
ncbi:hypothetical protein BDV93DRAFT_555284 [Ceratobasidium sp. AG-I]|nr:hypothetical protein BDV93DRAFT_555284 [Ceratobasidium sp. AG-I]